jgi:hypothetical protein
MKLFYHFVLRKFSLVPFGKFELDEDFNKYYTDCHSVNVKDDNFQVFIILYNDGERDYVTEKDYFIKQKQALKRNYTSDLKTSNYSMFGFSVQETSFIIDGNEFLEFTWIKS